MGYVPAVTKAKLMHLSKLLLNDIAQQQNSQVPQNKNKESNAIELDKEGFDALYVEILKQDARKLKSVLKGVELENSKHDKENE